MAESWEVASAVAALAYSVDVGAVRAPTRGRGYRPPPDVAQARKVAVHLTVLVSACDCASLGRLVGMHRDTVHSHCAEMRELGVRGLVADVESEALEALVRLRLEREAPARRAEAQEIEDALRRFVKLRASGRQPTSSDRPSARSSDNHENVIELRR